MKFERVAAKVAARGKGRSNHADHVVGWAAIQKHVDRMTRRVARGRSAIAKAHHPSWKSVSRSMAAHDHVAKRQRD